MQKRSKKENFLVYDASCAFCTGLAGFFHRKLGIKIVPNDVTINYLAKETIQKDVHFVIFENGKLLVFHGAEAAVRMVGQKYGILIKLYKVIVFKQLFNVFYWIVKKLRKRF